MAPPPGTLRVGRYFAVLVLLIAGLYTLVFVSSQKPTPKLGIDLVGGREVIFKAIAPHGKAPTTDQMTEAKQIIAERANPSGTTGATVNVQGDDQLVVKIPGGTNTDVSALGRAAVLNFRPLVTSAVPISCATGKAAKKSGTTSTPAPGSPTPSPAAKASSSGSRSPNDAGHLRLDAPGSSSTSPKPTSSGATTPAATPTSSRSSQPPARCSKNPLEQLTKTTSSGVTSIPTSETAYNALVKKTPSAANSIKAALANYDCGATRDEPDEKNRYYVACDKAGKLAFLLGTIIVPGNQIDSASAQAPNTSGQGGSPDWTVQLNLKSDGADAWASWTSKYNTKESPQQPNATACGAAATFPCSDYVAFTLDGQVISSPVTQSAINHQATSISGGFQQKSANALAQQLNYGALPLSFDLQSNNQVSATLGTQQLKAGLLAGGIGLVLVILYSLIYYRGLGLVTIASLVVSAGLTYAMLVILGRQIGFNLDLSGIAGFIVAIGITADSFVVFFERIKDEVHDGRSMRVAVPRAWARARRTVLSADFVSFLAAAILYYFAAGDVRGFAFTLGLSTILDLIVVFLFTHPIVSLLSRSRAFGSARFTGLNAVRSGGVAPSSAGDDELLRRHKRVKPRRADTAVLDPDTDTETVEDVHNDVDENADSAAAQPVVESSQTTAARPGTAAERAAARRARMRDRNDEPGDS